MIECSKDMINIDECKRKILLSSLAAFIDGEGTIKIMHRLTYSNTYSYQQQLMVGNTDVRLIEWLVENFGGTMPKPHKVLGENRKDSYDWRLSGSKSCRLLKLVRPYLMLKQEQADGAIMLYEKVSKWKYGGRNNSMPPHKRKLAETLYQRNKELNKRGKNDMDNEEEVEVLVPVKVRREVLDEWL